MKKIIVLFSGKASNLENILTTMHNKKIQVIATFTNNKQARGIGVSERFKIPCMIVDEKNFSDKDAYNKKLLGAINKLDFDLVVLAGYMKIIPEYFISNIQTPMINIHPSLLPLHKGLDGAKKSYEDDSRYGGASVHYVVPQVDSGEIITQKKIDKSKINNFTDYQKELSKVEFEILPIAITKALKI
ncbi:Phosphoribosylglycinamide formyltransferase [hydrothermal vent metagenome]|uniref:phosphoribosylglycinamide formyltransferase 1 n=1 Tax=hydrothermal vent metagenome TaxID=652676 RepID=A0A3B1EA29_9ZZZZ